MCWRSGGNNGNGNGGGNESRRGDAVNLNLNIGCMCTQGSGAGGRNYGSFRRLGGESGYGYESMFPCQARRDEFCLSCGQPMRWNYGEGARGPLTRCEVGWRPRFESRERRRYGITRCLLRGR